jgi:hypothetical protein
VLLHVSTPSSGLSMPPEEHRPSRLQRGPVSMPRYAVNPMPPSAQRPSWLRQHGKTVAELGLVVAGVAVGAAVVWTVVQAITGGAQPPACTALQNQLAQLQAQQFAIYKQGAAQGGTFTQSQASEVQSLQTQIASVINQMTNTCVAPPGSTLEKWINQAIVYAGWVALALVGIVGVGVSALVIRWFVRRWGGSASNPDSPPSSPADVTVSSEFDQATMGSDAADGEVAGEYGSGAISSSDASSVASNLALNDPATGVAGQISAFFTSAAETASDVIAAILDALATLWSFLVTALSDAAFEFTLFLTG